MVFCMTPIILYSYFRSSASYRARIALYLKKIPFEYRAVNLMSDGGEQYKGDYWKYNPMKELPCLVDGERRIAQSMAILQYVDEKWSEPRLFPKENFEKSKVIQFCENINAGIQPLQNLKVLKELEKRFKADQAAKEEWMVHWISRGLESLELMLAETSKDFCFGNSLTAADVLLVPQVYNARRYKVDLSKLPNLVRVDKNCCELEAFKKAHPSAQPDSVA